MSSLGDKMALILEDNLEKEAELAAVRQQAVQDYQVVANEVDNPVPPEKRPV